MNEELDSQLSAMFDDELPTEECDLLARRLSRDEPLKARWGRYAVIGAAIRAERGVRLDPPLAGRVSKVILDEPALVAAGAAHGARRGEARWWKPVAGAALAASVAAASILWLRAQTPLAGSALTAQLSPGAAAGAAATGAVATGAAAYGTGSAGPAVTDVTYVVPHAAAARAVLVPSSALANYVVAHSMVSSPVARRNLLSAFMTSESATPAEEPQDDAQSNVR